MHKIVEYAELFEGMWNKCGSRTVNVEGLKCHHLVVYQVDLLTTIFFPKECGAYQRSKNIYVLVIFLCIWMHVMHIVGGVGSEEKIEACVVAEKF